MASESSISLSMVVGSALSACESVCHGILAKVQERGFSTEDVFAVHLALEEAFVNAVRHGNKMDPDKEVRIEYSVSPDRVEITIADEGDGFDPQAIPDPRSDENLFKPNGRGLLLIQAFMDVVEHNPQGNRVHMIRYKERPCGAEEAGQERA